MDSPLPAADGRPPKLPKPPKPASLEASTEDIPRPTLPVLKPKPSSKQIQDAIKSVHPSLRPQSDPDESKREETTAAARSLSESGSGEINNRSASPLSPRPEKPAKPPRQAPATVDGTHKPSRPPLPKNLSFGQMDKQSIPSDVSDTSLTSDTSAPSTPGPAPLPKPVRVGTPKPDKFDASTPPPVPDNKPKSSSSLKATPSDTITTASPARIATLASQTSLDSLEAQPIYDSVPNTVSYTSSNSSIPTTPTADRTFTENPNSPLKKFSMRMKGSTRRKTTADASAGGGSGYAGMPAPAEIVLTWDAERFPNLSLPLSHRNQLLTELYTSERSYLKSLCTMLDIYMFPLLKSEPSLISENEVSIIFSNIDRIYEGNFRFLENLKEKLINWTETSMLGETLLEVAPQFVMYFTYCNNHDTSQTLLAKLNKKNKEFAAYIEACFHSPISAGLPLDSFLIMPVQRIPRYVLLIKDIVKTTPTDHPDYQDLSRALEEFQSLADRVNLNLRESESRKKMANLTKIISGLKKLDVAGRTLLKEGNVSLMSTKTKCQLLLFNDILAFATEAGRERKIVSSANVGLELLLDLHTLYVEDLFDLDPQTTVNDAMELYTPERPFTVYCGAENEKRLWMNAIRTAIAKVCEKPVDADLTIREGIFSYKDGSEYAGFFNDSQRNGRGKLSRADGSVYVGEWIDNSCHGVGTMSWSTGETYEGQWENGKPHGKGTMQTRIGDTYVGGFVGGLRSGPGKILYANGDRLEGLWRRGELYGRATLKCHNGSSYTGDYQRSMRHGKGIFVRSNGDTYSGSFKHDRRDGEGQMVYTSGDVYEGEWVDDKREGHGTMSYANGEVYVGAWSADKRHGEGTLTNAVNRESYTGEWNYDLKTGNGCMKFADGRVYSGSWIKGKFNGRGSLTCPDGATYDGSWRDDMKEGAGRFVWPNGNWYDGVWLQDQRHGKGVMETVSGTRYDGEWVAGRREGRGSYESSGGKFIGTWKDDKRHGLGVFVSMSGSKLEGKWEYDRLQGGATLSFVGGQRQNLKFEDGHPVSSEWMSPPTFPVIARDDF